MLGIQKSLLKRLLIRYGFAVGMVAGAFLLRRVLTAYIGPGWPTYITFYPVVMLVATVAGLWPGVVATALAALVVDYWILPPIGSFGIESLTDASGLAMFSGMGVFMSLVAEFYRRARQQAQERSRELIKANEALRELSSKLLSAHEVERKRIAGEIHDTLGACLAAIKFKVVEAVQEKGKTTNAAVGSLETIIPVIQEAVEECRRIQMDLRPSILDDLGLLAALSWFFRRFQTIYSGIRVEQETTIEESEIPHPLKIVIYRIFQEAMNNIAKHSKANLVRLCLRKADGRMELILQDNGQGFNLEKALFQESSEKGFGLLSMKERTELSGGSFTIESTEGKGTTIRVSWPV
jgi:signal transduction histidine kinase